MSRASQIFILGLFAAFFVGPVSASPGAPSLIEIVGIGDLAVAPQRAQLSFLLNVDSDEEVDRETIPDYQFVRDQFVAALYDIGLSTQQLVLTEPQNRVKNGMISAGHVTVEIDAPKQAIQLLHMVKLYPYVHYIGMELIAGDAEIGKEKARRAALLHVAEQRKSYENSLGVTLVPVDVSESAYIKGIKPRALMANQQGMDGALDKLPELGEIQYHVEAVVSFVAAVR